MLIALLPLLAALYVAALAIGIDGIVSFMSQ